MKKKLLVALAALAGLVVIFLIVVALQPSEYRVERSATMQAPPEEVFAHVNDFHHWEAWSPWADLDPNAEEAYEGPDAGEGAVFRWAGNEDVGVGSMTIVESRPHETIRIELAFVEPWEDTADVGFTFEPRGDETLVTWSMEGKNNLVGKAVCLFMDMDETIGGMYEQGLADLKTIVEAAPDDDAADATEAEESREAADARESGR